MLMSEYGTPAKVGRVGDRQLNLLGRSYFRTRWLMLWPRRRMCGFFLGVKRAANYLTVRGIGRPLLS
jgi:hypothetical protein